MVINNVMRLLICRRDCRANGSVVGSLNRTSGLLRKFAIIITLRRGRTLIAANVIPSGSATEIGTSPVIIRCHRVRDRAASNIRMRGTHFAPGKYGKT